MTLPEGDIGRGGVAGRGPPVDGRSRLSGRAGAAAGRASPGAGRPLEITRSDVIARAGSAGGATTAGAAAGSGAAAGAAAGATAAGASTPGSAGAGSAGSGAGAAGSSSTTGASAASCFAGLAAAFFAGFFSGLGSSGCSGRVSPSRSARRRMRSAWASMIDEEWLFNPMPRLSLNARTSALVMPSSLASSCTRMFFATLADQPFAVGTAGEPAASQSLMSFVVVSNGCRSSASAPDGATRRHARSKARRRIAASRHSADPVHSQAPRPGAGRPAWTRPAESIVNLVSSVWGRRVRQPTQVRSRGVVGAISSSPRCSRRCRRSPRRYRRTRRPRR